jgi:hypothetical protein
MFRGVCTSGFALRAKVEIMAHSAVEAGTNDWEHTAPVASNVVVAGGRTLLRTAARRTAARFLALETEVELPTREPAKEGSKRRKREAKGTQVKFPTIQASRENIHGV